MSFNILFGYGIQRLIDAHLRFVRAAHPVYLRMRNFDQLDNDPAAQLGFSYSPGTANTGTTDILIDPPPSVRMVSYHNIGQSAGKLRFGSREFLISASFVEKQQVAMGLTDLQSVFSGQRVIGLVLDRELFSIEDIWHEEVAGRTVSWGLTCNAQEAKKI